MFLLTSANENFPHHTDFSFLWVNTSYIFDISYHLVSPNFTKVAIVDKIIKNLRENEQNYKFQLTSALSAAWSSFWNFFFSVKLLVLNCGQWKLIAKFGQILRYFSLKMPPQQTNRHPNTPKSPLRGLYPYRTIFTVSYIE